jgi:hypothetical protein
MVLPQRSPESGGPWVICPNCALQVETGPICPRCGTLRTKPTPQSLSQPPASQAGPSRTFREGNLDDFDCSKCHTLLERRPSREGPVCFILGVGAMTFGPLLLGGSLAPALVGFGLLAWGVWRQSYPRLVPWCPKCRCRRG